MVIDGKTTSNITHSNIAYIGILNIIHNMNAKCKVYKMSAHIISHLPPVINSQPQRLPDSITDAQDNNVCTASRKIEDRPNWRFERKGPRSESLVV